MKQETHIVSQGIAESMSPQGTFYGIQALRFFAAFLVLYTHATFYVSSRVDASFAMWLHGAQGVPIFFVISGFVMALTARPLASHIDGHRVFLLHRLVRIVPLYWVVNAFKIVALIALPVSLFGHPDIVNIIYSLLFIPSRNAQGVIETFYGVGWTLNFAMLFYVLFALALWLRVRALAIVGPALISLAILSSWRQDDWVSLSFFVDPIVLNFLWGMLLAEYVLSGRRMPLVMAFAALVVGAGVTFIWPGVQLLGLQYATLVAGIIFLEPVLKDRLPKWLVKGGEASYALYLFHPLIGVAVASLLSKMGVKSGWLAMVCIIGSTVVAAFVIYAKFELPLTRWLRRRAPGLARARPVTRTASVGE